MLFVIRARSNCAITEAALNILYISQYFPPEMGAPAARVSELASHWTRAGHFVTVLTGFPNHPDGVVRQEYRKQFWRGIFRESKNGVNLVRTWLLPFPNRRSYERILNYTSFCLSASVSGSFLSRPDVIIATSPQLLVGLAGWWIAKLKRVPFILEVRDLWPESLAAVGVGGSGSRLHRVIGAIAAFLYHRADRIVVVTPAFRDRLVQDWDVPPEKLSLVQNGVETELFSPRPVDARIKEAMHTNGKFTASFIGTLGLAHGLETLLNVAERLQREAPEVAIRLIGDGADRARVQSLAQSRRLSNVCFVPAQPRQKIPDYISASDVCLVLLRRSEVFETVIPTKMLEFMSCACPVILGVKGQAQQILEAARAGLCVEPGDESALWEAIIRLKNDPELRRELGRNGREYIVGHLSRQKTAQDYLEVLRDLLKLNSKIRAMAA